MSRDQCREMLLFAYARIMRPEKAKPAILFGFAFFVVRTAISLVCR